MEISAETTDDAILGGRVLLRQPARGYRAAIDPLLLAAFAPARAGMAVLELGCGSGAALLALNARVPGLRLTGLEPDEALRALAIGNAATNGATAAIVVGSVAENALPAGAFDLVIANPPFFAADDYSASPHATRNQAHRLNGGLDAWVGAARRALRGGGALALVLHAHQLGEALAALQVGFGAVELRPVRPRAGAEATRVLIRAVQGRRTPLRLLPDLLLHGECSAYLPEAEGVLRDAKPLD